MRIITALEASPVSRFNQVTPSIYKLPKSIRIKGREYMY